MTLKSSTEVNCEMEFLMEEVFKFIPTEIFIKVDFAMDPNMEVESIILTMEISIKATLPII